ncbi:MFS general substrate transporter [Hymenopellis radicata]|nr:MFS general substrate transporter [Hymenopellis radicata]
MSATLCSTPTSSTRLKSQEMEDAPASRPGTSDSMGNGDEEKSIQGHREGESPPAHPDFPEGSARGWFTAIGGALVGMCTFGNAQSFGVYQDYYTRISLTEKSPSAISWIGSIQLGLLFGLGLFSGTLFDKGYFRATVISGSVLFLFSSFMLSLVEPHNYYQNLLAQGIGMGLGMGLLLLPSLSVVSHYFRRRRSLAMGIVITGGALGAVVYPILLNKVFAKERFGFKWGVRFVAFIDLFLLVLANLFMKPRLLVPPRKKASIDYRKIAGDVPYLFLLAGFFCGFWGIFIPFFYLQLFSKLHGVNPSFLDWAAPSFGRFFPNFLADKYGPLNILIPSGFITGSLVWVLLGVSSIAGMAIFAVLYGFFSGAYLTLSTASVASFSTSPTLDDMGLRIGIACFFMGLAVLTGNPIAGALVHAPEYFWWRPLLFSCISTILGTVFITIARQGMVKRKGLQRV